MRLHEAREVVEASSVDEADELLASGWILLAVVSGQRYVSGVQVVGPIYVLGKK